MAMAYPRIAGVCPAKALMLCLLTLNLHACRLAFVWLYVDLSVQTLEVSFLLDASQALRVVLVADSLNQLDLSQAVKGGSTLGGPCSYIEGVRVLQDLIS